MACNRATADFLLSSPPMREQYQIAGFPPDGDAPLEIAPAR